MSPKILIAFAIATSTFANSSDLKGRQVRYVAGSFSEIRVGCTGRLDARDPRNLSIFCGTTSLSISNSTIAIARIVESRKEEEELNINVPIFHRNKESQLVYIRTVRDPERSDWLLLEMPAKYARAVVVFLIRVKEDRDARRQNSQK
jgi:hypothetical protein